MHKSLGFTPDVECDGECPLDAFEIQMIYDHSNFMMN